MSRLHPPNGKLVFIALALFFAASNPSRSQEFPTKPITLIVGFAPGGFADGLARLLGDRLSVKLGQPVVVENRAGGGGNIAAAVVSKAPADGHTLLVTTTGLAINATLSKNKGFLIEDLKAVSIPAWAPEMLSVSASSPAKTLNQLVELAKTKPIAFASPGVGTSGHISTAYFFKRLARVEAVHIPFQGGAPAVNALLGDHVQALAGAVVGQAGPLQGGSIRGLAIASESRLPEFPNMPTYEESGYPGLIAATWIGIFVPAKTSDVIAAQLNRIVEDVVAEAGVKEKLKSLHMQTRTSDQPGSAAYFANEVEKWAKMAEASGVGAN